MANTCNNETFVIGSFDDVVHFSKELMNDVIGYDDYGKICGIYNGEFYIEDFDRIQGSPLWFAHFIYDTKRGPSQIILDLIEELPQISISARYCEYLNGHIGNATFHNGEWSDRSYPPEEPYCGSWACNTDCFEDFKKIKIDKFWSWREKGNTLSSQDEEIEAIRKQCLSFGSKIGRVEGFLDSLHMNRKTWPREQLVHERDERIQEQEKKAEEEWNWMVEESKKNFAPCMIEGCNSPSLFKWPPVPDGEWINDPNVCARCYLQLEREQGIIRFDDGTPMEEWGWEDESIVEGNGR